MPKTIRVRIWKCLSCSRYFRGSSSSRCPHTHFAGVFGFGQPCAPAKIEQQKKRAIIVRLTPEELAKLSTGVEYHRSCGYWKPRNVGAVMGL